LAGDQTGGQFIIAEINICYNYSHVITASRSILWEAYHYEDVITMPGDNCMEVNITECLWLRPNGDCRTMEVILAYIEQL